MTQAFENLIISGVKTIAGDIVLWGKNKNEHNFRFEQVLKRSRKVALKLNRSKMKSITSQVSYIGTILTAIGLKPDRSKVRAAPEMPSPAGKLACEAQTYFRSSLLFLRTFKVLSNGELHE